MSANPTRGGLAVCIFLWRVSDSLLLRDLPLLEPRKLLAGRAHDGVRGADICAAVH